MATKQLVEGQLLTSNVALNGGKPTVIRLPADGRRAGLSQKPGSRKEPYFFDDVSGKFKLSPKVKSRFVSSLIYL